MDVYSRSGGQVPHILHSALHPGESLMSCFECFKICNISPRYLFDKLVGLGPTADLVMVM